jgi:hypothetical protein
MPLRFESFSGDARGGIEIIEGSGTTRIYLTPIGIEGQVAVRRERDGQRETLTKLDPLASAHTQAA